MHFEPRFAIINLYYFCLINKKYLFSASQVQACSPASPIKNGPENPEPLLLNSIKSFNYTSDYLYCAVNPFAMETIFPMLSSFNMPFLNSANTSGNLFSISVKKCASNSFTFLTATSFNNP